MNLSEFITPDRQVARSVNLERDIPDKSSLNRYLLTGKGLEILGRFRAGLNGEKVSAWSLTGPYGMGKSSFVHFLLALCGPAGDPKTQVARGLLERKDTGLHRRFQEMWNDRENLESGFLRVATTASFEPINHTLAKGLAEALRRRGRKMEPLLATAHEFLAGDGDDTGRLIDLFQQAGRAAGAPVAVVIDELGKNLEYLARYPGRGDLFILQRLAETEDVFLWVCLHQAFEEYAAGLTAYQRQEWGKVQGRFEDISFVEPRGQMLQFISETLARRTDDPELNQRVGAWAGFFHDRARQGEVAEVAELGPEVISGFYPLHPLTALLLPELCVRFAQNDRTLFAFLCGGEPHALPGFLAGQSVERDGGKLPTFGPEYLYDYFLSAAHGLSMGRPGANRWLEIHDMIEGARGLPERERRVLKVIGLLNLFSGPSGFRASQARVILALSEPGDPEGERRAAEALEAVSERGLLMYRAYADEYRLWEGTDFDVSAAIEEQKANMGALRLDEVLEKAVSMTPLVASAHSYRKGTLRHFERRWATLDEVAGKFPNCRSDDVDGLILYVVGKEADIPGPPACTAEGLPLVIAYARFEEQIRELILEAAAAKAVLASSPELERDGVARREARFRANAADTRLKRFLSDLYAPGNPEVVWRAGGEVEELGSEREFSALLSRLCDQVFHQCPVLRNELINRNQLSSAASRARRELTEAMLNAEAEEGLGLSGTGPEVAIYRTMLLGEDLHQRGLGEAWRFVAPGPGQNFHSAWRAIENAVNEAGDAPLPLPELMDVLGRPPFGMKTGPIPVLICLFLLVRSDEMALYQEGAFLPYLTPEDLELMVKRPEYFALRKFSPLGMQGKVFRVYQELLNASAVAADRELRNATMVNIVGPMVQFADGLSDYAKQTRSVSPAARRVLRALLHSKDPIQLLFADLPEAVGVSGFDEGEGLEGEALKEFQNGLRNAIGELVQADERLREQIGMVLLKSFGEGELSRLREELAGRAAPLVERCSDGRLRPLVAALAKNRGGNSEWVTAIGTIASQRPVDAWRDSDLTEFSARMHDLVRRFSALERLASAERKQLPGAEGKEARLISLTRPDGRTESEIVWLDEAAVERSRETVEGLLREKDVDELKSVLVMLGERLFGESGNGGEEP